MNRRLKMHKKIGKKMKQNINTSKQTYSKLKAFSLCLHPPYKNRRKRSEEEIAKGLQAVEKKEMSMRTNGGDHINVNVSD